MNRTMYYYLLINYSGQRIGNPWDVNKGLVRLILMHISFLMSGVLIGIYLLVGLRSLPLILILIFVEMHLVWKYLRQKIEDAIKFQILENGYVQLNRFTRIFYFVLSVLMIFGVVLSMFYLIKIILILR